LKYRVLTCVGEREVNAGRAAQLEQPLVLEIACDGAHSLVSAHLISNPINSAGLKRRKLPSAWLPGGGTEPQRNHLLACESRCYC